MKYIPSSDFNIVSNALNFSTIDCHIIGGCDMYTTKAAGGDKKLYKNIDNRLESQYESLVRLSASLSPPARSVASDDGKGSDKAGEAGEKDSRKKRSRTVETPEVDLSRASPFGPLSQLDARRTFAYLIATLNASHPDYEFSHVLKPSDFRKERSLRGLMQNLDNTLHHLRPKPSMYGQWLGPPGYSASAPATNGNGNEVWSSRMWEMIDKEMGLRKCDKFAYVPDRDPFDEEESAIWSMHYFFFNKERKRVCYLYLRCLSIMSHSPMNAPAYNGRSLGQRNSYSVAAGDGANKRASYWLGDKASHADAWGYDDDDEAMPVDPEDDEIDVPYMDLDDIRYEIANGYSYDPEDDEEYNLNDEYPYASSVRGMSEEIGDAMEI